MTIYYQGAAMILFKQNDSQRAIITLASDHNYNRNVDVDKINDLWVGAFFSKTCYQTSDVLQNSKVDQCVKNVIEGGLSL